MSKDEVRNKVKQFFLSFFNSEEKKLSDEFFTENFFGSRMRLAPRDVLAFLYALEKEFAFMVSSDDILAGKFNNLSNVVDIVYNEKNICQKNKEESI